jgi:hypothetical protein
MRWTRDEFVVLLAFYFKYPRASHTDSHPDCILLAAALGRTPSAIDSQLRNLDYDLVRSSGDRHVSAHLLALLNQFKDDIKATYREANSVVLAHGWGLPRF